MKLTLVSAQWPGNICFFWTVKRSKFHRTSVRSKELLGSPNDEREAFGQERKASKQQNNKGCLPYW